MTFDERTDQEHRFQDGLTVRDFSDDPGALFDHQVQEAHWLILDLEDGLEVTGMKHRPRARVHQADQGGDDG